MRVGFVAIAVLALLTLAAPRLHAQSGIRSVELGKKLNDGPKTLVGFVDLHTHPVNHISFGGKIFHGAPDVGVWMPKDMRGCGLPEGPAIDRSEALSDCAATHKMVAKGCGNVWRGLAVSGLENENEAADVHGKPALVGEKSWPAHDDITHQQMWVDWMERAYRGGQRVMVALVTNNKLLGDAARGDKSDDDSTIARAIPATIKLVGRHKWMEIAKSPADVRRIVGEDRMAVILGTEVDDIGGMVADAQAGKRATDDDVRKHIRALHALGVRYIFPVHVVDNLFAGTAAYRSAFDLANRYLTGFFWSLRCVEGVNFRHKVDPKSKLGSAVGLKMDLSEHGTAEKCAKANQGHVNTRGLTRRGALAIDEMMRLGMLIDVDHMSHQSIDDTIAVARAFHGGYPLVSGHSSLLDAEDDADPKGFARREDKKLARHYQAIRELGGIVGIEWDSTSAVADAKHWVTEVGRVMRYAGKSIAFGTDINGMVVQPKPPATKAFDYSAAFPRSKMDGREWDYNTEGMVHYGLIVDFLKDVERLKLPIDAVARLAVTADDGAAISGAAATVTGPDVIDALFAGAESFALTWERAHAKATAAKRTPAPPVQRNVHEVPAMTIGPLCPTQHRGGREFNGKGPWFHAKVTLRIVDAAGAAKLKLKPGVSLGASALIANVAFEAKQTKGGNTRAKQDWDDVVATAPRGFRFANILGPKQAAFGEITGVGSAGGFQLLVAKQPPATMWLTPARGAAVDEFMIVGDTGGPDISKDEDCTDDTSVTAALSPVRLELVAVAERTFDALDVKLETGGDGIRGGEGSAFVRIDFEGGQSAEIDVTALGKKKNQRGTIKVPLGRSVRASQLRWLNVRHISNKCVLCKTDHWTVSSVVVTAPDGTAVMSVAGFDIADSTKTFAFP